jgi:protein-tyrosine phosphatase
MASVLVVCTGNVCRSPIAEGFLRAALLERWGEQAPSISSAGTAGWEGAGAMPESVASAAERGVDISNHVARRLAVEGVREADLVIAMADEHRRAIEWMVPEAGSKTFTLKELVRLLEALPAADPTVPPDVGLKERVREADALRRSGFAGNPLDEDVVDPLGLPLESYRAVAWELDGWCSRLADGLFGPSRTRSVEVRGA